MKRAFVFACIPALSCALLLAACGSDEKPDTSPTAGTDAGSDAATHDAAPDVQIDAGPPVRTVETRPRFGTLDPENLLLDGDFELSAPDALQYPWFQFTAANVALGTQCRSGLRCAYLQPGESIWGVFMWPDGPITAEFYARISGKSCDSEATGLILSLGNYLGAPNPTRLTPTSSGPDKDGYCHYTANESLPHDTGSAFWALVIADHQNASAPVTVDDASVKAAGGSSASSLRAPSGPPTSETLSIVQSVRDAYAKLPPVPPRGERPPVIDQTGRHATIRHPAP